MCDPEEMDEQRENSQINWFVAIMLVAGSPLFVWAFTNHHWAEIALKVYLVTASVLGYMLLFSERKSLKQRWLWIGMVPVLILHSVAMYLLILFNETFPQIDRFPVATYGVLVLLATVESVVLYFILGRFRPRK